MATKMATTMAVTMAAITMTDDVVISMSYRSDNITFF
jgi:hypothetical protein